MVRNAMGLRRAVAAVAAVAVVAAIFTAVAFLLIGRRDEGEPRPPTAWFAPYVDVVLPPPVPFDDPAVNPAGDAVLAFVVAAPDDGCAPTWGAAFGLDEAAEEVDLDTRVSRLRQRGGDVLVSFGGAINDELATTCTDVDRLTEAYQSVVDRYRVAAIDFDIENHTLDDGAAHLRRAAATAQLQRTALARGTPLEVWLTLPAAPTGLPRSAVEVIDAMLDEGVALTGVNLMTMNYGAGRPPELSMVDASTATVRTAAEQLAEAFRRAGRPLEGQELWARIGVTPMIGQNSVLTDVLTADDARRLAAWSRDRGVGRFGMWSLNRDRACPGAVLRLLDNRCSGVEQDAGEFSEVFNQMSVRQGRTGRRD